MGTVDEDENDEATEKERARRHSEQHKTDRSFAVMMGCIWVAFAAMALGLGSIWYFLSNFSWTKGRPLRGRRGQRPRARHDAHAAPTEAAAHHWLDMAQEEYESIAAFSELALDLMAAGAPTELVTRCHEAALDEARHTELCLSVASCLNGKVSDVQTPSQLRVARRRPRWKRALLVRLAVESYIDGWVGEASSARVLAKLARDSDDGELRDALRVLAREEMGHAALGEDIVRWCRSEGGPIVEHALTMVRKRLKKSLTPCANVESVNLRHLGVPDHELRSAALEAACSRASLS
jgi:uncharacterized ferritin-like protein (DUF455 family)